LKIFASDIDGCLANTELGITERAKKYFGVSDSDIYRSKSHLGWHHSFGVPKDEWDQFFLSNDCWSDPRLVLEAEPITQNIIEMNKWVLGGWVPSLITSRTRDLRLATEAWCAKHHVPYGNLLVDAQHKKVDLMHHIDASFIVEDNIFEAVSCANAGFRSYLLETHYNLPRLHTVQGSDNLWIVKDYQEITMLEEKYEL
jgi:uncharacterized HAD superfamily protein